MNDARGRDKTAFVESVWERQMCQVPTPTPQKKYCCSSGCSEVAMGYEKMGDADRCTETKTTCLYACKHNNAGGGFRLCDYSQHTDNAGVNLKQPPCRLTQMK